MKNSEIAKITIKSQIAGDKAHGWGVEDSLAIIAAIWKGENGDEMPADARAIIRDVINPSAFRQKLEKAKMLNAPVKKATKIAASYLDALADPEDQEIEPEADEEVEER